jgi:hypothetical protein
MKINIKHIKTLIMAIVCAIMLLIGNAAVYGQAAGDDGFLKTVSYTSESLRDPFEGYIHKEVAPMPASQLIEEENFVMPVLLISGITWGSSFPQAIINGKIVQVGDQIGEVQVAGISKEGVVFAYKRQKFSLPAPGANSGAQSGSKTK